MESGNNSNGGNGHNSYSVQSCEVGVTRTASSDIEARIYGNGKSTVIIKEMSQDERGKLAAFQISSDINAMDEVEKQVEKLSMKKAHIEPLKLFFLGCVAGWWVGLAVILTVTLSGGIPVEVRNAWPMLPKMLVGFFFPTAIWFIMIFGGELFTGNSMYMIVGFIAKRVTIWELLYNWSFVLVSNFTGCVATVYFFGYLTDLFVAEPAHSYITHVAEYKINLKPEVAFLRAIPANALVCTCVLFGMSAKDMTGKLVGMWFPIFVFATSGFEHAIANMAYVPLGLMYGAEASYKKWLYQNLLLVILGNIVGGGLIVGLSDYYLFDWTNAVHRVNAAMLSKIGNQEFTEENLRKVFASFDQDGNGTIERSEFDQAIADMGVKAPPELINTLWMNSDTDGNGCLDFDEFSDLLKKMRDFEKYGRDDVIFQRPASAQG
uniref:EF-hand domain-containing protein n=1 Tax=Hanusia phi TaxID=3032 RepID=A0A7S0HG13_9CRYP